MFARAPFAADELAVVLNPNPEPDRGRFHRRFRFNLHAFLPQLVLEGVRQNQSSRMRRRDILSLSSYTSQSRA